jgi:hypothetical protein
MDLISPPGRKQPATVAGRSMTPRDRRAHEQFAREYAEQTLRTRAALLGCTK